MFGEPGKSVGQQARGGVVSAGDHQVAHLDDALVREPLAVDFHRDEHADQIVLRRLAALGCGEHASLEHGQVLTDRVVEPWTAGRVGDDAMGRIRVQPPVRKRDPEQLGREQRRDGTGKIVHQIGLTAFDEGVDQCGGDRPQEGFVGLGARRGEPRIQRLAIGRVFGRIHLDRGRDDRRRRDDDPAVRGAFGHHVLGGERHVVLDRGFDVRVAREDGKSAVAVGVGDGAMPSERVVDAAPVPRVLGRMMIERQHETGTVIGKRNNCSAFVWVIMSTSSCGSPEKSSLAAAWVCGQGVSAWG